MAAFTSVVAAASLGLTAASTISKLAGGDDLMSGRSSGSGSGDSKGLMMATGQRNRNQQRLKEGAQAQDAGAANSQPVGLQDALTKSGYKSGAFDFKQFQNQWSNNLSSFMQDS